MSQAEADHWLNRSLQCLDQLIRCGHPLAPHAAAVLNGRTAEHEPIDDRALLAEVDAISDRRSAIGIVARRHATTAAEIAAIERRLRRKRGKQTDTMGCPFTKA